jgi:hypothetical protein
MKFLLASLKTFLNLSKDFSESRIKISVLAFMFFHWLVFFRAHVKGGFRNYFSESLAAFRTVFPAAFETIFRMTDENFTVIGGFLKRVLVKIIRLRNFFIEASRKFSFLSLQKCSQKC